ncbi:MAG: ABC transporter permease, partial [Chlamydiia bacterium]|nr:ABC transporter permease [Chlamydiia bacterium]
NGIAIDLPSLKQIDSIKLSLIEKLKERGIDQYWNVTSYTDYELTAPILQQLKSDKTLFSLIAMIILIVACSNIISMLILLVNDKRKEIAVLQALGASPLRIATLFGLCGLITGFLSSLIGTLAALFTLRNLQSLVGFLNFLQGHEAFHQAFYGNVLPNNLSLGALGFVTIATIIISILAGVVPAIKAAKIRPSQILRSE